MRKRNIKKQIWLDNCETPHYSIVSLYDMINTT